MCVCLSVCVSVCVSVSVCVCVCFVWSALADDWPVRRAWFGVDRSVRGGHFVDCESRRRCVSTPTNKILPTNDNNYSRTEGMAGGGAYLSWRRFFFVLVFCFGFCVCGLFCLFFLRFRISRPSRIGQIRERLGETVAVARRARDASGLPR